MMSTEFNEAKGFLDVMPLDAGFIMNCAGTSNGIEKCHRDCAKRQMHV
jgi:hypothetical protein